MQGRAGKEAAICTCTYCTSISTCRVQSIHTHVVLLDRLYIPCICSCPVLVACPTAAYCTSTVLHENSYSISLRSPSPSPSPTRPARARHTTTDVTSWRSARSPTDPIPSVLVDHHPDPQQHCTVHLHTSIPISCLMPPRRNPLRKAQEPGSSDSDDSVEVAHTHAIKRPRSIPSKKVCRTWLSRSCTPPLRKA